jgi:hypothetical protein
MKPQILALLVLALLVVSAATVLGADLAPGDVRKAIDEGVRYLKDSQNRNNGTWPDYPNHEGGMTALCTLALLNAGVDPKEEHLAKSLHYLNNLRNKTTYVVSLQTMALCRAKHVVDYQDTIDENVQWLVETQVQAKDAPAERRGGWGYPTAGKLIDADGSNSQFALLALYEAARVAETGQIHLNIPPKTWELARSYWFTNQREDGGWPYKKAQPAYGSMTCAGIAAMAVCGDMLHEPDAKVSGDHIDGCYRAPCLELEKMENGLEWLRQQFSVAGNPPVSPNDAGLWHFYYLYGLERAGRLSARRKIGEHDWYREGAALLVEKLGTLVSRSSWKGRAYAETDENLATSFALLFLSKGRWPVLMAKVQYGEVGGPGGRDIAWNRHRNDVNNLKIYVESKWRRELTWQVIDLRKATVDDLLQMPVLFFSGGGNPLPDNERQRERLAANLRDYVDRGGFIFADGESCSDEFDKPFRQLMDLVFQKPEYRFRPLDGSHPIWRAEEKVPVGQERLLLGIDYGCRTSVVYAPSHPPGGPKPSLASLWELSRGGFKEKYSRAVKEQIQGGMAIGINVLAYATNREFLDKDEIPAVVVVKGARDDMTRGKVAIAILRHLGGCDAAPRALANLMEQAGHDLGIRVETHPKLIGMQDPALFDYPVVFMHGRNAFHLTDGERHALRDYVERGGLLFADAICGSESFARSFRDEMDIIFGKNRLLNIPPGDPIWTAKYGGANLARTQVMRIDPQQSRAGEPLQSVKHRVPPELQGVRLGDRYGVIFSEFDLSCALEKHESMECHGYTRDDAARIGLNVLRYAMQQ